MEIASHPLHMYFMLCFPGRRDKYEDTPTRCFHTKVTERTHRKVKSAQIAARFRAFCALSRRLP
ncbi:MAG: hypothetical protein JWN04_2306 [Myxococcaceae bacterium]|nr:hypothetical protein [Myxococcaceae bacterium]